MKKYEFRVHLNLHTAMIDRLPIVVFVGDELIGAGRIVEITEDRIDLITPWILLNYSIKVVF